MRALLRTLLAATLLAAPAAAQTPKEAPAISGGAVRIGVLADMSTGMADNFGTGSVTAARLALEDFGPTVLGRPIELVQADHQSKPDVAMSLARRWYDDGVDMITDLDNSAIALGVQALARDKGRLALITGSGSTVITGAQCSPKGALWVIDTYALARTIAKPMVEAGDKSWYYIVADITLGKSFVADVTPVVTGGGGKVVGQVFHPLLSPDLSSQILQAQSSGAGVIALFNVGADAINAVKQASEFGVLGGSQKLAGFYMTAVDVHALGLKVAGGMYLAEAFYWDTDDATRAFAQRFFARQKAMPNSYQAGVYSAVTHYLKAVQAAGTDEAGAVMARMRELPIDDFMTRNGRLRPDGRVVRDVSLFQVKRPEESTGPWDVMKRVATLPGDDAFRSMEAGDCPLVRKP
ncbi:ABC transporter substrate-binding protein [Methylobacterium oryzihabitans]|uniref:ABC transporter substrate-binding protein n=1 Tax=Methylobacterium oryzihabitans TaxID=2499852 RepID=A0A3S2VAI3_9HYPH|nr:ABC transporter substrate-binding protein [Methylobacterium oryzihabitans]RVU19802.1 ABC transporter substrate-binding protein [Methylobacterium oryzihabitans]